jgi:hypothetical protein
VSGACCSSRCGLACDGPSAAVPPRSVASSRRPSGQRRTACPCNGVSETGKVGALAAAVEGAAEKAGANGAVEAVLAACTPGAVQVAALRTLLPLLSHPQVRRLHVAPRLRAAHQEGKPLPRRDAAAEVRPSYHVSCAHRIRRICPELASA